MYYFVYVQIIYLLAIGETITYAAPNNHNVIDNGHRTKRIVGGLRTEVENIPWQVNLRRDDYLPSDIYCGGSIISENWIITAGHCACPMEFSEIMIASGPSGNQTLHEVANVFCHPNYQLKEVSTVVAINDVALIRLKEPLEFDSTRKPIELYHNVEQVPKESTIFISGWGSNNFNGTIDFPMRLRSAEMTIMSREACDKYLKGIFGKEPVSQGQLCTKRRERGTPCYGDSGGPGVVNNQLVGVASWINGDFCEEENPAIYAEVGYFRQWISNVTSL